MEKTLKVDSFTPTSEVVAQNPELVVVNFPRSSALGNEA